MNTRQSGQDAEDVPTVDVTRDAAASTAANKATEPNTVAQPVASSTATQATAPIMTAEPIVPTMAAAASEPNTARSTKLNTAAEPTEPIEPIEGAEVPTEGIKPGEPDHSIQHSETAEITEPLDGELEPFARFAPEPERLPRWWQRAAAACGRVLGHEWTLASLGGLLLAVVMTWPTLRYPLQTIPQDIWDPTLQAWQVAWAGHALLTDPSQLWHANAFWPNQYSYAFSDTLLGYAPFALLGTGPAAAVLRYNILFVLAYALAFVGVYALARQLGAGRTGAAVAGVAFAYAPWRLAQAGHLHVMSSGGIALALAMLARGHGFSLRPGKSASRRPGWALAGWLVAAWQITLGFGIGLPFGYVLAAIVVVAAAVRTVRWIVGRSARPFGWRLWVADAAGGAIFAAVALLMAQPYLAVVRLHPYAARSEAEVALYSPPLYGLFTAPAESWLWGDQHAAARAALPWHPEMTLLPGFVLYGLAIAGLVTSIWRVRTRILLAAGVALSIALAMGTRLAGGGRPGYLTLYDLLPGWNAIRTPGRLVLWTTLLLAILAAGAVSMIVHRAYELTADQVPPRPGALLRLATLIPLLLVLVEGVNRTPHPDVPTAPVPLRTLAAPILVLPSDQSTDQNVMLWSTDGFPAIVNGGSGFTPDDLRRTRESVASFPSEQSIDYLRRLGVRTVVVLPDRVSGTPWEHAVDAHVEGLGITREERENAVIFHLN